MVHAEITLIHAAAFAMVNKQLVDQDEVKKIRVRMLADSCAYTMAINESIQAKPDISFVEKKSGDGRWVC